MLSFLRLHSHRDVRSLRCDRAKASRRRVKQKFLHAEELERRLLLKTTLFSDNFESGSLSSSLWARGISGNPTVQSQSSSRGPINPLGTYALNLDGGTFTSHEAINSKSVDLRAYEKVWLEYRIQAGGRGDLPEGDDDLRVAYKTSPSAASTTLKSEDVAQVSQTGFTSRSILLPSSAYTQQFFFGFSAADSDYDAFGPGYIGPLDDWFIDNVKLVGSRAPSVSFNVASNGDDSQDHTLSWTTSDPDGDSITSVTAKLLRGNSVVRTSSSKNGSLNVLRSDGPGTYKLQVTAKDSTDVSRTSTSSTLVVSDDDVHAPVIEVSDRASQVLASGTQVAAQDQFVNWVLSDQSGLQADVLISKNGSQIYSQQYDTSQVSVNGQFDFNDYGVGNYIIAINATDNDNDRPDDATHAQHVINVNVINSGPTALFDVVTPVDNWLEGSAIQLDASASSDPEGDALQYVWDLGDGTLVRGQTVSHVYPDNGDYQIELTVVDEFGGLNRRYSTITIGDVAPQLTAIADSAATEAADFNLHLSSIDLGDDSTTYWVDWGDGSIESFSQPGDYQHVYQQGGSQPTLRIGMEDEDGTYPDQYVAVIDVQNGAPQIVGFPAFVSAQINTDIGWELTIVDGASDVQTVAWDFGDSTVVSGVGLTSASHRYSAAGTYNVSVTVNDSDGLTTVMTGVAEIGSPVSFTNSALAVNEDAGTITIEVELENGTPLSHDVIVDLEATGVAETDYDLGVPRIVIPQGSLTGSTTIAIKDDTQNENVETLIVGMATIGGASVGAVGSLAIEITDNDELPSVYLSTPGQSVSEDVGQLQFTATLATVAGRDVYVPVVFSGSAAEGVDYLLPDGNEILIPAGDTSGSIRLDVVDDTVIEPSEIIAATLQGSSTAQVIDEPGRPDSTTIVIVQNDAPSVSLDSAYRITTEDTAILLITARLDQFATETITVPVSISGTAEDGSDYRIVRGMLEFFPGVAEATIRFQLIDDNVAEGVETLAVELQGASNVNLGTTQLTVTDVLDDDVVRVSFDSGDVTEFEGNLIPFKVLLSNPSDEHVVVPILVGGTANGSDFFLSTETVTFSPGQQQASMHVELLDDVRNELTETVFLTLSNELVGGFLGDIVTKQISILDTDPLVSIVDPAAATVVEQNGDVTFRVALSAPTDESITVPLKYSGTAKRNADYTAPSSITIPAGATSKSFNVSLIDDATTESKEAMTVAFRAPNAGILASPTKSTLSIEDNDAPVSAYWKRSRRVVDESSAVQHLTIGLTRPAEQDVIVDVTFSGVERVIEYTVPNPITRPIPFMPTELHVGSFTSKPVEGDDFVVDNLRVVIPQGQTEGVVVVKLVDDAIREPTEEVVFTLANVINADLAINRADRSSRLVILDRDALSSEQANSYRAELGNYSSEELSDGNEESGFADAATEPVSDSAELGSYLYTAIEFASDGGLSIIGIPGVVNPADFTTRAVIHALVWTQEQYPAGTLGIDIPRLQYDMDLHAAREVRQGRPAGNGIYFKNLSREMIEWSLLQVTNMMFSGLLDDLDIDADSLLRKLTPSALNSIQEFYEKNKEQFDQAGKHVAGFFKDPAGTTEDELERFANTILGQGGYLHDSTVFFDRDFDMLHSSDEPYRSTSWNGEARFEWFGGADSNSNQILDVEEGQWVVAGGVDISVDQNLALEFSAPANFSVVTPSSSVVAHMLNTGAFPRTLEGAVNAENQFLEAVGLPSTELADLNLLEEAASGNVDAAAMFAKDTQIYNSVFTLATLFDATEPAIALNQLATHALVDLAGKLVQPGASMNLTSIPFLESIVRGVTVRTGIEIDSATTTAVTSAVARSNDYIDELVVSASPSFLDLVVQAHRFAQTDLASDITALASGTWSVEQFNTATQDVGSRISTTTIADVLPVYLFVESVTIQEGSDGEDNSAAFTVRPFGTSVHEVSVNYQTNDLSAIAGEDYVARSGILTWSAGDDSPRIISIPIRSDSLLEADEAFQLEFFDAQNATLVQDMVNGFITNDDAFEYTSLPDDDETIVVSTNGDIASVEVNGVTLYDAISQHGSIVRIEGQHGDSVAMYVDNTLDTSSTASLDGTRTMTVGPHTIHLSSEVDLSEASFAAINGLPNLIFAGSPLSLTAAVPEYLDEQSLDVSWEIYATGHTEPALTQSDLGFDFVAEEAYTEIVLTLTDGLATAVARHQIHVYPPNVAPVAVDDSVTTAENDTVTVDVVANDTDLNPDDSIFLVPDSLVLLSATRDSDGSTIELNDATIQQQGDQVVLNPGRDFDFLPDGESVTLVIEYTLSDDNVAPLTDTGTLTIRVVGQNDVPVASGRTGTTSEDGPSIEIHADFVDVDALDTHRFEVDVTATLGTVTNHGDGTFSYDPNGAFESLAVGQSATDQFAYTVVDSHGAVSTASVEVTITGQNDGPTIESLDSPHSDIDNLSVDGVVSITGRFDDLDATDTHTILVDWGDGGSALEAVIDPGSKTYSGVYEYSHGGIYTITVTLSDRSGASSNESSMAFVQGVGLVGETLYVVGSSQRDQINIDRRRVWIRDEGTFLFFFPKGHWEERVKVDARVDGRKLGVSVEPSAIGKIEVYGHHGNDQIHIDRHLQIDAFVDAGSGDDHIRTGAGNDTVLGGDGKDWIFTEDGNDTVVDLEGNNRVDSGDGDDQITTGPGRDLIWSGRGDDSIVDSGGNNQVFTGSGNDVAMTGNGDDRIFGEDGRDVILAGAGNDWVSGGDDDDVIVGGDGRDSLSGNNGRDLIIGGAGQDHIFGGRNDDLLIAGDAEHDDDLTSLANALAAWVDSNLALSLTSLGDVFDDDEVDYVWGQRGSDELVVGHNDKSR